MPYVVAVGLTTQQQQNVGNPQLAKPGLFNRLFAKVGAKIKTQLIFIPYK